MSHMKFVKWVKIGQFDIVYKEYYDKNLSLIMA